MLQPAVPQQYEIEMVTLEELVPTDHLLRKIDHHIDFTFIRDKVEHLYCPNNGRPALDPVRFFKILLLGYLFGIPSERKLVKEIEVNVAYRWFLRMGLTEKVIDASTLSQTRIRRFHNSDIYEYLFEQIVQQAIDKGLVGGEVFYSDSTHLKADANGHRFTNELRPLSSSAYLEQVNQAIEEDRLAHGKAPLKPNTASPKQKNTKVSTTDPDSGFMHRDHKPKGFFYLDHRTVDGRYNIILDTYITPGNVHDSQPYIRRLDHTCQRFQLKPQAVGLDAGYFTAPVCGALESRHIAGVFGYRRPIRTKNKLKKKHFEYDAAHDRYQCPQGHYLTYQNTSRDGYRRYISQASHCRNCSILKDCTQSQHFQKVITRHVMQDSMDRANERRLSAWGKRIYQRRCETVERSFADAKQHHGHRYARFRGINKVQMQSFLAATAQNMKKIAIKLAISVFIHNTDCSRNKPKWA